MFFLPFVPFMCVYNAVYLCSQSQLLELTSLLLNMPVVKVPSSFFFGLLVTCLIYFVHSFCQEKFPLLQHFTLLLLFRLLLSLLHPPATAAGHKLCLLMTLSLDFSFSSLFFRLAFGCKW